MARLRHELGNRYCGVPTVLASVVRDPIAIGDLAASPGFKPSVLHFVVFDEKSKHSFELVGPRPDAQVQSSMRTRETSPSPPSSRRTLRRQEESLGMPSTVAAGFKDLSLAATATETSGSDGK